VNIPDRPLYKFLGVDKNLTPSWQDRLSALLSGQCYLSSAADFNDPFDCYPYLAAPSSPQERAEWVERMVPLIVDSVRQEIPADFAHPWARDVIDRLSDAELIAGLQKTSVDMAAAMGVFCLAECLESILMWSHYASNHQGIALRFEFDPDPEKVPIFWKVTYQDDRPILRHTDFNVQSYAIAEALATKAEFWRYEQEWRIMLTDHARTTLTFDPTTITGIILGAKCSGEVLDHARVMASSRGLEVMRMVPDQRTFELISHNI
jgi:hypothetical protein